MRFYLLGRLRGEAEPGEKTVPAELRLRKGQGLLAYLLLFRSQAHPRDHLADLFWSDVPEARARDSLSTTLKAVRAWMPGTGLVLVTDRNSVQLDLGTAWLDVAELEAGLAPGADLAGRGTALSLYTGDLLVDWTDNWCVLERERLRRRVLDAGITLVREYLAASSWDQGTDLARRLLEHDPLAETLHDLLLRLLIGAGNRIAAQQHYQQHAALLRTEFDLDPAPLTQQLYRQVLHPAQPSNDEYAGSAPPAHLPFHGRQIDLAVLQAALTRLRQGQGGIVLVRGEAGAGKTRLVKEALLTARGLHRVQVHAQELDREVPFSALLPALTTWLLHDLAPAQVLARLGPTTPAVLMQLLPGLATGLPGLRPLPPLPPAEAQAQLRQAVVAALLAAAAPPGAPAVLFCDDLHLADPQTLQVLGQLPDHLPITPLLVIATYRPEEVPSNGMLAILLRTLMSIETTVLTLAPLRLEDVQAIVEPHHPLQAATLSRWLHTHSGGNAFYLTELLRGLLVNERVLADSALGGWYATGELPSGDDLPMTTVAQTSILARFYRLSPAGQKVVLATAVMAGEISTLLLAHVTELVESDILAGLEEGLAWRFLRPSTRTGGYLIGHALIKQGVCAVLSPTRSAYLHGRIAAALEEQSGGTTARLVLELAYHYGQSTNIAKQREYFYKAAEAARAAYAYETAVAYYRQLLPLLDGPRYTAQRLEVAQRLQELLQAQSWDDEEKDMAGRQIPAGTP